MKRVRFSLKKRYVLSSFFVLVIIALFTNPTNEDYISFNHKQGKLLNIDDKTKHPIVKIQRVNFYIFSTYTPYIFAEHGITHLGVFGHFIQISDGQFDYPKWLQIFN